MNNIYGFFYLNITLDGENKLSRILINVQKKLKNFTEPLTKSAQLLLKDIDANFVSEGGLVGGWAPLKPATVEGRLKEGFGAGPILQRTRRYRSSFKASVNSKRAVIESKGIDYHKYHQSSAPRIQGKSEDRLPRRQTLFLREGTKKEIDRYFQEYFEFN